MWITLCTAYPQAGVPAVWLFIHRFTVGFLVAQSGKTLYNTHMEAKNVTRKKRTDRNHIVYELRVPAGNYIGVTAKTESTIAKSVRVRANKHFYRAKTEAKDWTLCVALRELEHKDQIEIVIHAVIRGKAAAHKEEVRIRRAVRPNLNTDVRGD